MNGSESFQPGDPTAYAVFYEQYKRPIYLFAYNMLANEADAEDVTIECFSKLWIKWTDIDDQGNVRGIKNPGHVRAFLYTTARHQCIDILRTRRRRPTDGPDAAENLAADEMNADLKMMRTEIIRELWEEIDKLPTERMKNVFLARFTGPKKSAAEIAAFLGIDEKAVYNDTFSARRYLKTAFLLKGFDPTWVLIILSFSML